MSHTDPTEAFRQCGMTPPDGFTYDGEIHRFSANGKPKDKSGWYTGTEDGDLKVLIFGDWRMGDKHRWTSLETNDKRTKEYKQAQKFWEELRKQAEEKQKAIWEETRKEASAIWKSSQPATEEHPYLRSKGVLPHAARVNDRNQLVIPLMDEKKQPQTLQFIEEGGEKLFLPGGKVKGGFFWMGNSPDEETTKVLLICEGFATGATLHECTGYPVVVAFNAGNLRPVLHSILPRFGQQAQVVIAGDDDRFKDKNTGKEAAKSLAQEFGIRWVVPSWPEGSESGTDFNDLSFQISKEQLQQQVQAALDLPAETPANWWKVSEKGAVSFSSQFAARSWVQSHVHRLYQHPDLWEFNGKVWERLSEEQAKAEVHRMVCRGRGAEEGILKANHIEDTFAQAKLLLQHQRLVAFDRCSSRLVFRNGTLDLDSAQFLDHQFHAEDHNTILKNYDYNSEAKCPRWQSFLREVELEEDTILRLQEWCGYCLIPATNLQRCLMLVGDGKNGKSVFLQTLREVIGSDNVSSLELAEMFDRFKVGQLQGKLANICSDVDTNTVIHTSFKKIVAGEHTVAERKHLDPFEFQPFARILFSANRFTPTRDHSEGFYRRFDIVRFRRHFSDDEKDPELLTKLQEELPGIFNWSLAGLVRLLEQQWNLSPSESMSLEHQHFQLETHPLRGFLQECCELGQGEVETDYFIQRYKEWCEANGYRMQSANRITRDLAEMKVEKTRQRRASLTYVYRGIRLL